MNPEEVLAEFPYGARVSDPVAEVVYDLVHMHVSDGDTIAGWAYPNKDFYFDTANAKHKDNGYLLSRQGDKRVCFFSPLSKTDGDLARKKVDSV